MMENGEKISLLLVDDRADKLLALESVLADLGAELVKAGSGRDALRILLKREFAVILLDVSMPELDGFETASLIRQRESTEHTPIIFITSISTSETHVTKGYALGAVDYIFSPIIPEILRTKVSVFIDLHKKNHLIKEQSKWLYREAEKKAHEYETRLRSLLNRLNVGVFRASEDGKLLEANPALLRLVGAANVEEARELEKTRLLVESITQLDSPSGLSSSMDLRWYHEDGTPSWLSLTGIRSRGDDQRLSIEVVVEDITARKLAEEGLAAMNDTLERRVAERSEALLRSQEELRRAERLASLGTLATGIAHEINNPLNAILATAEYALALPHRQEYSRSLQTIAEETRRCGKIIHGVLQFARNQKTVKSRHDLNTVIVHSLDILRTYIPPSVSVERRLSERPLPVEMNTTEIEQVLTNIVQNAVDASAGNARISIYTERHGAAAVLKISDDGPGIAPEIVDKIFDPFFSTRATKGGTGLGLSVSHGIIMDHQGTVTVESALQRGTSFIIRFPLATGEDSVEDHGKVVGRPQHGAPYS